MKSSQIHSLSNYLLPHMKSYAREGQMIFATPVDHILRGFYFEDSGFDPAAFYVWVFFLPMYVPTTHVSFTFGKRLGGGGGRRWTMNDANLCEELLCSIQQEGFPFLRDVEEPRQLATAVQKLCGESDPYGLEAIAYSLVMAGEFLAGLTFLNELEKKLDMSIKWQGEILKRATQLGKLLVNDPENGKRLLAEWERITAKNLFRSVSY
jgi:hypothetical protein